MRRKKSKLKLSANIAKLESQWLAKRIEVHQARADLFSFRNQEQAVAELLGISVEDKGLLKISVDTSRLENLLVSYYTTANFQPTVLEKKHVFSLLNLPFLRHLAEPKCHGTST
eukprot:GILK01013721.1.p1 GENE.GILK01013721.1~~GILK01013721.1.p1  ORF type:complete len:114 (-),score=11.81 GILK01013721.1:333-674(-)